MKFAFFLFIISNLNEALTKPAILSDLRFCGYQRKDDHNYDGNETAIDEFPWLGLFIYKEDPDVESTVTVAQYRCSGSLINNRYVISTPLCVRFRTAYAAAVRLGEYNIKQETDCVDYKGENECTNPYLDIPIEETIKHPKYQYTPYAKHAIALFRLAKKVTYTDYVRPICLPVHHLKLAAVGDPLTSSGFGRIKVLGEHTVIKKHIDTVMISNEECICQHFGKNPNSNRYLISVNSTPKDVIDDNVFCTNDVEGSPYFTCEGDMGAPVMYVSKRKQWHLEGLVSWGSTTCKSGVPSTHTKVLAYMDWIAKAIRH